MGGPRREAQALGTARNGGEVDRLYINAIFSEQDVADAFGLHWIANHPWHDVRVCWHDGQTRCVEHVLQHLRGSLLPIALLILCFQMPYARQLAGHQYRRTACGENEAGRDAREDVSDHFVSRA